MAKRDEERQKNQQKYRTGTELSSYLSKQYQIQTMK